MIQIDSEIQLIEGTPSIDDADVYYSINLNGRFVGFVMKDKGSECWFEGPHGSLKKIDGLKAKQIVAIENYVKVVYRLTH